MIKGWHPSQLTREGRDTLWLLAVFALTLLPHVGRLPWWCSVGAAAAMLWRAQLAWRDAALPPRWLLFMGLTASVIATYLTYRGHIGREASVTFITLMGAMKTLELRAKRDAFLLTCLGFFNVLTQFFYSQSMGMALLMIMAIWALMGTMVLSQRPLGRPSLGSALKVSALNLGWALPLMLALYLFFPRFGPLWSLPSDAGAKSGLSNELRLGQVSELSLDDSIAMRVHFRGAPPAPNQLYFRGPVLSWFDGDTWSAIQTPSPRKLDLASNHRQAAATGRIVAYEATLEANGLRSLPLLDGTISAELTPESPDLALRNVGIDWFLNRPLSSRIQISAQARPGVHRALLLSEAEQHANLSTPPGSNPGTAAWAQALKASKHGQHASAQQLSHEVLRHIRESRFSYTLTPGEEAPPQPNRPRTQRHDIDQFWLVRQTGFCEHFASAYVFIMRQMGVPARIVTGFQGAERNPVDGMYVVRNSDAHAWAEFWQEGLGWLRVDPTAAVAPERIERSARQRLNQANSGVLQAMTPTWMNTLHSYMDATNHRWNVWVLQYAREQQTSFLQKWGFDAKNWQDLLRLCGWILLSVSLIGILWLAWQRTGPAKSHWHAPLSHLAQALQSIGIPLPSHSASPPPALSWLASLDQAAHLPTSLTSRLKGLLMDLDAMRYAAHDQPETIQIRSAKRVVKHIQTLVRPFRQRRT